MSIKLVLCLFVSSSLIRITTLNSSHLTDLKSLTDDVLYETYRTEKLSRTVHADQKYDPHFIISTVNIVLITV